MIDPTPVPAADTNPTPHHSGHQLHRPERRESPGRTRSRLKHHYLCISVIIRSSQLPLSPQEPGSETILPRCCEPRERRRGKIENDKNSRQRDWSKPSTSAMVGSIIDATLDSPVSSVQFRNEMFWLCWCVFVVWLCDLPLLYCIDCVEAGDRSQASSTGRPLFPIFFSAIEVNKVIIVEISTFRIVIKLCIKYNVTIIESSNTCNTSDNIETKLNCQLTRNLNIENIGMFCN